MPWSRPFDDPIPTEGKDILTLQDAADYMMALPEADQELQHWKDAAEAVIAAAEDRDFVMHARIGMLRAMHHGKPKPVTIRKKQVKAYRIVR